MLKARVEKIEGGNAFLVFEDGQTLRVPEASVLGKVEVGSMVNFAGVSEAGDEQAKQAVYRGLLNELLQTE